MVRVDVLQALVVGGRRPLPVPAEAPPEEREEPGGGPDGVAPHLLHGRPDGPLDEDPGEAGHAEQHGDGQEDVGDQAEQDRGPVDLEAGLVSVGNDVLSTVGEAVTGQAERHAEPAVLVLEVLVSRTLVLRPLPAGLAPPHQLVAREDQVDLGLHIPVPQGDLNSQDYHFISISPTTLTVIEAGLSKVDNILSGLEYCIYLYICYGGKNGRNVFIKHIIWID